MSVKLQQVVSSLLVFICLQAAAAGT